MNTQLKYIVSPLNADLNLNRPNFLQPTMKLLMSYRLQHNSSPTIKFLNVNLINFFYNNSFLSLFFITFAVRLS
jgi:hypothetical protein